MNTIHGSFPGSVRTVFSGFVLIVLLALVVAPDAFACHRDGRPHGKDTTCPPSGGEGLPPATADTVLQMLGSVSDDAPRICTPSTPFDVGAGWYLCETGNAQSPNNVTLNTGGMTLTAQKRFIDLCTSFSYFPTPPTYAPPPTYPAASYGYGWTQNCNNQNADSQFFCSVEVRFTFADTVGTPGWVTALTGGESDRVDVTVSGVLTGGAMPNSNPFSPLSRDVDMTQIVLDFKKPGSTNSLTECLWGKNGYPISLHTDSF